MRTKMLLVIVLSGVLFIISCGDRTRTVTDDSDQANVLQESDGSISLELEKAECYNDVKDPSNNTAEWSVLFKKPGRFDVWISSATIDTNDLKYSKAVQFNIRDKRLEAIPECDKVILNSKDVSFPYFRADSFIGSLYIQDTGLINIQVISEKILPEVVDANTAKPDTRMLSLSLTPVVR